MNEYGTRARHKYRLNTTTDKQLLRSLTRTPFIPVMIAGNRISALLDSGADFSLISYQFAIQTGVRMDSINSCMMPVCKGVSGESVRLEYVICMDIQIANHTIKGHRFYVLNGLVTSVLLGADFLRKLQTITLDFMNGAMYIGGDKTKVPLVSDRLIGRETRPEAALVKHRKVIPPWTEAFVPCSGGKVNNQYLAEPLRPEGSVIQSACAIVSCAQQGVTWLRVVNTSSKPAILEKSECVAMLYPDVDLKSAATIQKQDSDDCKLCSIDQELPFDRQKELRDLVKEYRDIMWEEGKRLPCVRIGVEHEIRLQNNTVPIAFKTRRLSPKEEVEVRKEIDDLIAQGLIGPSTSPWAAPIVCARRKNGKLRLAIDYRGLNSKSIASCSHPLPLIEDLLDRLGDAKYFSTLDMKSGYHQMPVRKEDRQLTSFVVPWGQYEWKRGCPFGLSGAPSSFQRLMSVVLGECQYRDALCYLDDILIWGESWEEHTIRLRRVFEKIRQAGMLLSPTKCVLGAKRVEYLGHVIEEGHVFIHQKRVEQLVSLPLPENVHHLRKALGAFAYVQRWIPGMSEITKPLYEALEKNGKTKLNWTANMTSAFEELKRRVANAIRLKIPNFNREFVLITDASDSGIGAMLANKSADGTSLEPIGFFHHALSVHEKRYCATDKELLAIVLSIKRFRVYLCKKFTLITDHKPLKWLNSLDINDEKGKRARWMEFLQQYEFDIQHKAGKSPEMSMADYLSRVGASYHISSMINKSFDLRTHNKELLKLESPAFSRESILAAQQEDTDTRLVIEAMSTNKQIAHEASNNARKLFSYRKRLLVGDDDILYYRNFKGRRNKKNPLGVKEERIVVLPASLRRPFLRIVHNDNLAGHMGRDRVWQKARSVVWWPAIKRDIEVYINCCNECQLNKRPKHPNRAPLQQTDIPKEPLEKIQIDFVGPFQQSVEGGYRYVLAIQDVLTRFCVLVPTVKNDAESAASVLVTNWITVFGIPKKLQSDCGSHFTGTVFEETCKILGIKHIKGTPGHAESQGQVERQNQLVDNLRCLVMQKPHSWNEFIFTIQFAHNTSTNNTTGYTPFELLFGRQSMNPESFIQEELNEDSSSDEEWLPLANGKTLLKHRVRKTLGLKNAMYKQVRRRILQKQSERQEKHASRGRPFEKGELVRIKLTDSERRGLGSKLSAHFSDRYVVIKRRNHTYWLKKYGEDYSNIKKRHFNDLVRAPAHHVFEWEVDTPTQSQSSHAGHFEGGVRRYPQRHRNAPSRLQAQFQGKHHHESRSAVTLSSDEDANKSSGSIDTVNGHSDIENTHYRDEIIDSHSTQHTAEENSKFDSTMELGHRNSTDVIIGGEECDSLV